jgi:hypothetical protein
MAFGPDFTFMGNQYRIEVAGKEFIIDLLFFSRRLRSLVAFELKRGEFKPEYTGKMNIYLAALDKYVKLPDENPSIGIILCKTKNEEIVERIFRDGHEIGNHTLTHKYLHGEGRSAVEREIDLCDDVIFNHSEYNSIVFRPPGGLYDADLTAVCRERGYSVILWSIDTRDWAGTSAKDICNEIYNNIEDGAIILMHDYVCGESHTAEALRIVIPKLKELGYQFVTVSELIGN